MKPLIQDNFLKLTNLVKEVPFNTLFAQVVLDNTIPGKVYVNDDQEIRTAYIVHPYGMSLLLGDSYNEEFNQQFKKYALNTDNKRNGFELMQTWPRAWDDKLMDLFGGQLIPSGLNHSKLEKGIIELNTRMNFKFDSTSYLAKRVVTTNPDIKIVPVDIQMFREMKGTVVPKYFWKSESDFLDHGIAYGLLCKRELASMAFAACLIDSQLELGIETNPEFRGKGFAEMVCSSLINYCVENNYEPVWACRKENIGSYNLALKLGFIPTLELPYYRLSN